MVVTIWGTTYEGAHFRGFASDTDDLPVMISLTGTEQNICRYILENFSYCTDEKFSVAKLVDEYKNGNIPQWDGCGGVVRIVVDGKQVFRERDTPGLNVRTKWRDLGTVDADQFDDPFNDVNRRVAKIK